MPQTGRIRKFRWIVVALIAVAGVGIFAYLRWRGMPRVAWSALNDADRYELLSLEPYPPKPDYYGREVLGRTIVGDPAIRERLNRALQSGVRESDGTSMSCFDPRHGIRVTRAGMTTDFVICFECRQVEVWRGDERIAYFLVSDSPKAVFDEVLKSAGVPLAVK